jgi:hypothetical protein
MGRVPFRFGLAGECLVNRRTVIVTDANIGLPADRTGRRYVPVADVWSAA